MKIWLAGTATLFLIAALFYVVSEMTLDADLHRASRGFVALLVGCTAISVWWWLFVSVWKWALNS